MLDAATLSLMLYTTVINAANIAYGHARLNRVTPSCELVAISHSPDAATTMAPHDSKGKLCPKNNVSMMAINNGELRTIGYTVLAGAR